ncbi:dipeptidase [Kineosporia sp. J2-2]|uniref:Dipeptidase n=1 Tax=Kineosporia corallincola TaxID=2835133 RepID=A0ABS5TRS9_9ACTN|nr:dipeptidase [Kineosporia corallincola]MBT0773505.1 dipeptidase [Kineosporia corallincola]
MLDLHSEVLATHPVFDGHNDLPWQIRKDYASDPVQVGLDRGQASLHTDIPRLRAGGVGAQFWSVFVPSRWEHPAAVTATFEQIDIVRRMVLAHPEVFRWAATAADVRAAIAEGRIASLPGAEGGQSIASSLGVLRELRRAGLAYMTLTHNDNTPWSASATGAPVDYGLTDFGRDVVREMNRIGMLVDLSHVHERTMHDALDIATEPVIFSHSSARAVTDHPRNVPDTVLERLRDNGGVLMVTFVPAFVRQECTDHRAAAAAEQERLGLSGAPYEPAGGDEALAGYQRWLAANPRPRARVDDVVAHLEHAREVVGPQHLGLGGDYDGVDELPEGMGDVTAYPVLLRALAERGWSAADLRALTSGNVLRVLEEAQDGTSVD